jgi:hypothetical protein
MRRSPETVNTPVTSANQPSTAEAQREHRCASATGSASYHLIENDSIMEASDEALDDNCETWWRLDSHPSGKWMIGKEYSNRLFVPIRRPGQRPPDKIERLLMTPNDAGERPRT